MSNDMNTRLMQIRLKMLQSHLQPAQQSNGGGSYMNNSGQGLGAGITQQKDTGLPPINNAWGGGHQSSMPMQNLTSTYDSSNYKGGYNNDNFNRLNSNMQNNNYSTGVNPMMNAFNGGRGMVGGIADGMGMGMIGWM